MDAIFFEETGESTVFEQSKTATEVLRGLRDAMERGYGCKALQKVPHVTLLNNDFYHAELR